MYLSTFRTFFNKWLPIFFGCHQLKERSFYFNGHPFPICARCTGQLIGILIYPLIRFFLDLNLLTSFIMILPLIIDGTLQLKTSYTSNNYKRLITGMCFSVGMLSMFIMSCIFAFNYGYDLTKK